MSKTASVSCVDLSDVRHAEALVLLTPPADKAIRPKQAPIPVFNAIRTHCRETPPPMHRPESSGVSFER